MTKYPLTSLLSVRVFREEAAIREVSLSRQALLEAKETEMKARQELQRYSEWRPGEEFRLFESVRGKILPQVELNRHREDIQSLRQTELQLEEKCTAAAAAIDLAEKAVEQACQRQFAAARDRQKIDAHKNIWLLDEAKRLAAAEEAQLEDFFVKTLSEEIVHSEGDAP